MIISVEWQVVFYNKPPFPDITYMYSQSKRRKHSRLTNICIYCQRPSEVELDSLTAWRCQTHWSATVTALQRLKLQPEKRQRHIDPPPLGCKSSNLSLRSLCVSSQWPEWFKHMPNLISDTLMLLDSVRPCVCVCVQTLAHQHPGNEICNNQKRNRVKRSPSDRCIPRELEEIFFPWSSLCYTQEQLSCGRWRRLERGSKEEAEAAAVMWWGSEWQNLRVYVLPSSLMVLPVMKPTTRLWSWHDDSHLLFDHRENCVLSWWTPLGLHVLGS